MLLSLLVTIPALVIPLVHYSFATMLLSFILLGIGNTLMQVSLNPLIAIIVSGNKASSALAVLLVCILFLLTIVYPKVKTH